MAYPNLDPEFKSKWLEALRSGKYPHGRHYLKSNTGYCCLGVVCEIVGIPNRKAEVIDRFDFNEAELKRVPVILQGQAVNDNLVSQLTILNDDSYDGFNPVIKFIEENL